MSLHIANFQRCAFPSKSGMSDIVACPSSPISDYPSVLPSLPPLPPPVNNSPCLFTQYQPLYVSCCTGLLYFSRCYQFRSVTQSLRLFVIPWTAALQAALSFTISQSLLKLLSIESVMPPSHLILCHPLFLLPSIFLNISVFSNESVLRIRRQKYWSFSFSIRSFQWIFRTDFL